MTQAITIADVSRTFAGNTLPAVDQMSLTVRQGELLALLGPSGAGKTTLLRLVAGFEHPDAGHIMLGDRLVSSARVNVPVERRGVGFVFQHGALFPHLTVRQNIAFGLHHLPVSGRNARVEEMATLAALDGLLDRHEHELSGGERQRAALARALARGNTIVLLDEPLSNVDRPLRLDIGAQIRGILAAAGATAVMVTHDQQEALALADRVAVLHRGRLEQVDRPAVLVTTPATPFVAAFLARRGSPSPSESPHGP
jgi:iron(III) transport system ATP-binding protein